MTPERLSYDNVRLHLLAFFEKHTRDSFPFTIAPRDVEQPVARELWRAPDETCLCGHRQFDHPMDCFRYSSGRHGKPCKKCSCRIYQTFISFVAKRDAVGRARHDPKVRTPVDWKTTWQMDGRFLRQQRLDAQHTGYIWLTAQETGEPAHHVQAYVGVFELVLLPGQGSRVVKCRQHGVPHTECVLEHARFEIVGPIERTEAQLEAWKAETIRLALAYRRNLMRGDPVASDWRGTRTGACGQCEFYEWCDMGRNPRQLEMAYTKSAWEPWAQAFGKDKKMDPRVFAVDNSTLKAQATCGTQALLRYGMGLTNAEQRGPLAAGTALHAVLEVWLKGKSSKQAMKVLEQVYGGA